MNFQTLFNIKTFFHSYVQKAPEKIVTLTNNKQKHRYFYQMCWKKHIDKAQNKIVIIIFLISFVYFICQYHLIK